ncbi:MAG: ABC transporter ATP-binding protein [Microscillaceae bacterium]|nr:ABC transporter ATP-binding protein [Microscillaceae bacterium]
MIQTQNLAIGYKTSRKTQKIIAAHLNMSIAPGECIALLGKNGVGKSTLLKTLSGIIPPIEGNILIHQKDLQTLQALEKAQALSLVLTESIQLGYFKVVDLVSLGRYPYTGWLGKLQQEDKRWVDRALELSGMSDFREKNFIQLSDGEKQKVLIARALAQDTPLMILDEPSNHLDYPSRMLVFELLQKLARQTQKSILVATHDLEMALHFCNRVWLMFQEDDQTTRIEAGLPEELALKGSFEKLFKPSVFTGFLPLGNLSATPTPYNGTYKITGDAQGALWTHKALEKATPDLNFIHTEINIQVEHQGISNYRWILSHQEMESNRHFHSLEALIQFLKKFSA